MSFDLQADLDAIARLHEEDAAATIAQDFEALGELLDAEAVVIPPESEPLRAHDQLAARIARRAADPSPVRITEYRFEWAEVEVAGDWAYARGKLLGAAKPAPDAGPAPLAFNMMRVFRRQADGGWKVYRSIWNEAPL